MVIITVDTPKAKQPFGPRRDQLYDHQLSTLYHLQELEKHRSVTITPADSCYDRLKGHFYDIPNLVGNLLMNTQLGVLSSPTGTGKTHPMVALSMEPYNGGQITQSVRLNRLTQLQALSTQDLNNYLPSTLIVIPKNIYPQWLRVIQQSGVSYHGLFNRLNLEELVKHSLKNREEYPFPRIVLCKHTLYNETVGVFQKWSRVVLDEADTINIPGSRQITAGFTWLVTATAKYLNAHNHKGYWREILYSIDKPVLEALEITIDENYALECLHHATAVDFNILCQAIHGMNKVAQYLPKRVQEMMAAGDFSGAVKELGGQSHDTESVTEVIMKYFDSRIKNTEHQIEQAVLLEHKHDHLDQRLKDLNERKEGIIDQIANVNADCAICHDQSSDISLVQCCFQTFCTECIVEWMAMKKDQDCPYCRLQNPVILKITASAAPKIVKGVSVVEESVNLDAEREKLLSMEPAYNGYQTLPKLLDYILGAWANAKIIVVTSFNLQAFQQQLENNQYQFNVLNHVSYRKTVQEFNSGHSPIILLDAKYNGAGIDLEQTTDMIYMQELEPNLMKQTKGRAIRLSRPLHLPLRLYHLRTEGEGEPIDRFRLMKRIEPKPIPKPQVRIKPIAKLSVPMPTMFPKPNIKIV